MADIYATYVNIINADLQFINQKITKQQITKKIDDFWWQQAVTTPYTRWIIAIGMTIHQPGDI